MGGKIQGLAEKARRQRYPIFGDIALARLNFFQNLLILP
jgi:hypothetical protein